MVAALGLAGCGGTGTVQSASKSPPGSERPDVRSWMRSHFVEGRAIRDAVAQGELEEAHSRLARVSAQAGPRDAPPSWGPPIAALRAAARDASEADDLPGTARGFGLFAARCADCHVATDADVEFESPRLPAPRGDAPAPMQRHQWAAEQMWQGLVGPAPERYRNGANVLAQAPLHSLEIRVGRSPPLEVLRLAEHVRDVAGRAARAESQGERADLYGELLSTCASCHGQL